MIGLRNAMYGVPKDEIVVVAEAGGDPPNDDLHDVRLDPDHPERSEVVVRKRRNGSGHGDSDKAPRVRRLGVPGGRGRPELLFRA